ncbi:MAG: DNA (cytosine-5-)-methyltransferase, partial [Streptococcaceae bacterium]|nr:DNA (cytosine-5-)-methyltransferase [Streptococcaceae bacterium]
MSKIKVFSMFDGVGGFVVGLDKANKQLQTPFFETLFTNQFEPSRKTQDAFEVGVYNYPTIHHSNEDIMKAPNSYFDEIRESGVNMIVGGFPCQDYSVARSKKHELGIEGKKGVLFWEIIRATNHIQPDYLILENVDRLLKSPSSQRGRDFAIMLGAFNQLGYSVEWRVINAADYGRAQRRHRVFFF